MYRIIPTWWNRSLHFLHLPVGPHGFYFLLKFHVFIFGCAGSLFCTSFSLITVHGLLIAVASRVAAHRLWNAGTSVAAPPRPESVGSVVVALGLSCSTACGIFLDQGSNPCLLVVRWILYHWATREAPALMDSWLRSQFQWQKKNLSSFPTVGLSMPGRGLFMTSVAEAWVRFLESFGGVWYICTWYSAYIVLEGFFFSFCSFSHS